MNKEYFTDNLSVEDIAEMTDKMLKHEKMIKNRGSVKTNFLKMIPAAATVLVMVGLLNYAGILNPGGGDDENTEAAGSAAVEQNEQYIFEETAQETADIDWAAIEQRIGEIPDYYRMGIIKAHKEGFLEETIARIEERNAMINAYRESEDIKSIEERIAEREAMINAYRESEDIRSIEERIEAREAARNALQPLREHIEVILREHKNENAGSIITQIGDLIITTPADYEPVQNADDTITLPGGGTFTINDAKSEFYLAEISVLSGYNISRDDFITLYNFTFSLYKTKSLLENDIVIIEFPNGTKWTIIGRNGSMPQEIVEKATAEAMVYIGLIRNFYDKNGNDIFANPENKNKIDHFKFFDYHYDAIYSEIPREWSDFIDYDFSLENLLNGFYRDFNGNSNIDYNDWYGENIWLNPDGTITGK